MGSCRRRDLLGYVRSRTGSGPPTRGPAPGLAGRTRACPPTPTATSGTGPCARATWSGSHGSAGPPVDLAFVTVMTARHRAGGRLAATEARDGAVPEVRELARRLLAEQRAQTASWGHGGGPGQELAALVEQFGMDRWRLPAERRFALECIVVGTVAFVWLGFLVWGLGGQRVTRPSPIPSQYPQDRPVVRGAPPRRPARGHRDRRRQRLTASRSRPARASRRVRR